MISMNGYQPKIDRSKIKVPEYLKKIKNLNMNTE